MFSIISLSSLTSAAVIGYFTDNFRILVADTIMMLTTTSASDDLVDSKKYSPTALEQHFCFEGNYILHISQ